MFGFQTSLLFSVLPLILECRLIDFFWASLSWAVNVSVLLLEFGFLSILVIIPYAVKNYEKARRHSMIADGTAHEHREPPRDIMKPHFFQNKLGLWINHAVYWTCHKEPRGVAILIHGHSEHHRRFIHVAEKLNENGFVVFGMDHQGFGRSEGDRAFVEKFEHYPNDILDFMKQIIYDRYESLRELPRFFVGHSLGGLIAIHSALLCVSSSDPAHRVDGLILSSPALYIDPSNHNVIVRQLASILDFLVPKVRLLKFPPHPSTTFLQVKLHASFDPLNTHLPLSVHQGLQILSGIDKAQQLAPLFDLPILIFHGLLDRHVDIVGTETFFSSIKSEDKTFVEMENIMHEPWQEEKDIRDPILNLLIAWALDRVDGKKNSEKYKTALAALTVEYQLHAGEK